MKRFIPLGRVQEGSRYGEVDKEDPNSEKPKYTWRRWGHDQTDDEPVDNVSWYACPNCTVTKQLDRCHLRELWTCKT